ncbi:hypothetical protein LGV61_12940 [Desulfurispirillum indicum]|uniref:hypothetical protein n=1 Tax=Desulfurispirillum indicum TaxID=936456 RepID=UPI001CFA345A|nr:hypothetical protein [Desulfurispirillum indicum]UCZ56617.1 hypothetical protein LGV61_12940 [Desulfurispirillum indicum]
MSNETSSALQFYFKYAMECDALYYEYEDTGDDDKIDYSKYLPETCGEQHDSIYEQLKHICQKADDEAKHFLKSITSELSNQLSVFCNVETIKNKNYWSSSIKIWRKRSKKNNNVNIWINLHHVDGDFFFTRGIWINGGRSVEQHLLKVIKQYDNDAVTAKESGIDCYTGNVILKKIPPIFDSSGLVNIDKSIANAANEFKHVLTEPCIYAILDLARK